MTRLGPGWVLRRVAIWLLVAAALADPRLAWTGARESVVVAVDRSWSAAQPLGARAGALTDLSRALESRTALGVIGFGGRPYVAATAGAGDVTARLGALLAAPADEAADREQTDIAAALTLAGTLLPDGGKVVLASDGRETRGDARAAARALAGRGVTVDVLPLDARQGGPDAAVDEVILPAQVAAGASFPVRAVIRANREGRATVRLTRDGVTVAEQVVALAAGATEVRFSAEAGEPALYRYGVRVTLAEDGESRNDAAERVVRVGARPRVLWIGAGVPRTAPGVATVHMTPDGPAGAVTRLDDHDAVVLADVEAEALPPGLLDRLDAYVRERGGGLVMLGGRRAFAPGGYRGTVVEPLLPVDLDPGARQKRSSLAVVVALDKSGSMGDAIDGPQKLAVAREATIVALGLLAPGDRLAVLAFDGAVHEVVRLAPPPAAEDARDALAPLQPGGTTRIAPVLAAARAQLERLAGWRCHVVLITDGRAEGPDLAVDARRLAAGGITVSTIAIGADADTRGLRELAQAGGGRFEVAADAARLSGALRRDLVLARGPVVNEARTDVVTEPHPLLAGLADRPLPPLLGWISVAPRPGAAVPVRTTGGDPVLALGEAGIGRTAVVATDPDGAWGAAWRTSPAARSLVPRAVAWVLRPPTAGTLTVVETAGPDGRRTLDVHVLDADGQPLDGLDLVAHLRDGATRATAARPLEQSGVGRYTTPLIAGERPVEVVVEQSTPGGRRPLGRAGLGLGYPDELRVREPDTALLDDVRRAWGGQRLEPGTVPALRARTRTIPLWPALLLGALALLLLDLGLRGRGRPRLRPRLPATMEAAR